MFVLLSLPSATDVWFESHEHAYEEGAKVLNLVIDEEGDSLTHSLRLLPE